MITKKLIYLDNAATSHFKPKCVTSSLNKALKESANPGRSGHKLSIKNSFLVYRTRQKVANYFGLTEPENVVFTKNCTEALNIAILGTVKNGGNIICSCFEHNSVLRPLNELKNENKITLTIIEPSNKHFITKDDVLMAITNKTYLVIITAISNVTGNKNDVLEIGKLCKEKGLLFLVDCAQSCGHICFNMKKDNINYIAFAGHKGFLAPQGIGGLCINSNVIPNPIMYGGTGTESVNLNQPLTLPEKLESGTLQAPLIISLYEGINYIEKHFLAFNYKVKTLTKYLIIKLKEIKEVTLYTYDTSSFGVVSFNINGFNSNEVSDYLDTVYNIATRSGLHCAPLAHKFLGTTNSGTVRISLNFKNSKKDIDLLIIAIKNFIKENF